MRIILSGGGTAGHIYPALTVADQLRAEGHEVEFIGTPDGPEARLAREAGLMFHALPARGFDRSRPFTFVTAVLLMLVSTARAWRLLGQRPADVVVGFGGYVSLPVGLAASVRKVPLVLHEQNSVPGMANRVLSGRASAVGVTYASSAERMKPATRTVRTGNPVRQAVLDAKRASGRDSLKLPSDARVLLVFGGSRGARHINEAMISLAPALMADEDVHVLHIAGSEEAPAVRLALASVQLQDASGRYRVIDYLEDMASALAAADVIVSRAGATSIAEITAVGRAAVLVPYPYATEDHQSMNARDVAEAGGALVVADSALDEDALGPAILSLLGDKTKREAMAAASAALGIRDAGPRLVELILQTASFGRSKGAAA